MYLRQAIVLSVSASVTFVAAQTPAAYYNGGLNATNAPVHIRVATGGAGQSGILKALADAFIIQSVEVGSPPFQIAWYTSDTFVSIDYLRTGAVDVAITYNQVAEDIAIEQGIAEDPSYYAWRDHFMLVGPQDNPANLTSADNTTVLQMFRQLYIACSTTTSALKPIKFLSRFDKSATNVRESSFWIQLSQTPWSTGSGYSTWYHQFTALPIQALTAAAQLGEYTLTDRGTFLTVDTELTCQLKIYKASTDDLDDPLLNPAHLLIGTKAQNLAAAQAFVSWVVDPHGGQQVIKTFSKNGQVLYSVAP